MYCWAETPADRTRAFTYRSGHAARGAAGLPSELLQRRPDILQAEQDLAAATARIGMAKADRFPKLSITGILGVASPHLSRLVANETAFGVAGPGLAARY